jgi:hypothetical protein
MRNLPFNKTYTFGIAITPEAYLKNQFKYKVSNGKYDYYLIKDVVFILSHANYVYIFMFTGKLLIYTKDIKEICLWFPDNYFDSFLNGEIINNSMVLSHTGDNEPEVTIYLPLGYMSRAAKLQKSRYLNIVDPSIAIKILDDVMRKDAIFWRLTGRKIWIADYIF